MTYDSISHEYGLPIRVGMRVRRRSTGCEGEVAGPRPKARKFVRVAYDHHAGTVICDPREFIYLDAPVWAQLPDREVAA